MLYLVGLGLADETDITVKGLEAVKKAERVYLEAYTSILLVEKEKLVCVDFRLLIVACLAAFHGKDQGLIFVGSSVGSFLWTPCYCSRQRISREWQR